SGAIFRRRAVDPHLEERGDDAIAGFEARDARADRDDLARAIGARNRVVVEAVAIFAGDDGVVAIIERGGAEAYEDIAGAGFGIGALDAAKIFELRDAFRDFVGLHGER